MRLTNTIAAGGNILPAWVQVPGFSEEEIPPDKVPKGYIVLKVPRLSGSISENSWGYIILMRKGVGIETRMFQEYEEVVVLPHITKTRREIAGVNDQSEEVPNYLRSVLSNDGGVTQLKALQRLESLKLKVSRNIEQIKYAKQTSGVEQACDAGNLHPRERHHAKTLTLMDLPKQELINPIALQLHELRDRG